MTRAAERARITELDAVRGIAAMLVLLFHYTWHAPKVVPELETIPLGLSWGTYGVELFFAISGFVIFMTLERTRRSRDFLVSRFARLFPAYWAGIAITTAMLALFGPSELAQPPWIAAVNLTMLQGFLYLPSVEGVYWSLTVELAFYFWMWVLWRMRLLGRIEGVLIGWIALKLLWWLVPALSVRLGLVMVTTYIPYFAVGIAAYRVWAGQRSWREQVPLLAWGMAVTLITEPPAAWAVYLADLAVLAALVERRLGWLRQGWLLWLGALSYPIYLIHQFAGYAVIGAAERAGASPWLALFAAIAFALAAAQAIHSLIEAPALAAIRGWWRNREARLVPAE